MEVLFLVVYCILLFAASIYMTITMLQHNENFVAVIIGFLSYILSEIIGFFIIINYKQFVSIFYGWGIFLYAFIMFSGLFALAIVCLSAIIVKIRKGFKNNKNQWIDCGLKTAAAVIGAFLFCMLLPYAINYAQYKNIEAYSRQYLEQYIAEYYPHAVLGEFSENIYSNLFHQSLEGFKYEIYDNGEKYIISTHGLDKNDMQIDVDNPY